MAENVLGTIFGRADTLKRQLYDMIRNPSDYASMVGGRTQENMAAAQALQNEAFSDPQNPLRITNPQALNQLTQMITSGPMGFAPAGMTKSVAKSNLPTLEEFRDLASQGQMRMAKDKSQELKDLQSGKSKFAELNLNWDDPDTYKLVDKLESKGYKFIRNTVSDDPNPATYFFKNYEDVQQVLKASNQAERGKAYGYSDADIARFYTERYRGYPEEQVYKMWAEDSQGLLGP